MTNHSSAKNILANLPGIDAFDDLARLRLRMKSAQDHGSAMVFINIVNFKLINLDAGLDTGDDYLSLLAEILTDVFANDVVGRRFADHFVVMTGYDGIFEKLRTVEQRFRQVTAPRVIETKAGIYRIPEDVKGINPEIAISCAKIAADTIKHDARYQMLEYTDHSQKNLKLRDYVVSHLDEAIEKGWVRIYMQPIIRGLTGRVAHLEALARWDDPHMGFLSPAQFIGALEQSRQIDRLDRFIIKDVCRTLRERIDAGQPVVPVSVNFSRLDFVLCDMLAYVQETVAAYHLSPSLLVVEITESMLMQDGKQMFREIDRFRRAGFNVWMDDFGSGYSSLNVLKDYSFDLIKIDMGFVRKINERSKIILRSIVDMSKELGMFSLVEGIETKEQADFMIGLGCDFLQGYYYAKPLSIDDCQQYMGKQGAETLTEQPYWDSLSAVNPTSPNPLDFRGVDDRFQSAMPLAFIEYRDDQVHFFYLNELYRAEIAKLHLDTAETLDMLSGEEDYFYHQRYIDHFKKAMNTNQPVRRDYLTEGKLFTLTLIKIRKWDNRALLLASCYVGQESDHETADIGDRYGQLVYASFDLVGIYFPREHHFERLFINSGLKKMYEGLSLSETVAAFADRQLMENDRERFLTFVDTDTLKARCSASPAHFVESSFMMTEDGKIFEPKRIRLTYMSFMTDTMVLFTVQRIEG